METLQLRDISETALLPLWARAMETLRPDAIIHDDKALEMYQRLNYDFKRFSNAWLSQLAIAIRTDLIDKLVTDFITVHPHAVIINLGAGFDSRYLRVDNGQIQWFDLDLPNVIAARRLFFSDSDRYHMLEQSLFDVSWLEHAADESDNCLILAEGVLMYFTEQRIKQFFNDLAERIPHARMLLEMLPHGALGQAHLHEAIGWMNAAFQWTLHNIHRLESWNSHIKVRQEWCILDYHWERWGALSLLAWSPWHRYLFGEKLALLEFD
ncbi:class I SAM-dependent methyltransferase [Hahella sp. KA22]|nr:class I SAM-dependent methyltransferase [Hahella sp. KA22]